jgi:hypothetical protein
MFYASLSWAMIMKSVARQLDLLKSTKIYYLTAITRNLPGLVTSFVSRVYLHRQDGQAITLVAMFVEILLTTVTGALTYLIAWGLAGEPALIPYYYPLTVLGVGLFLLYPPIFRRGLSRVPG